MNPYWDNTFFEFFETLAKRIGLFCTGESLSLASDELQLLVLLLVSISCSLVGLFLVFRRLTMLANALSHTILTGVVITFLIARQTFPSDAALIVSGLVMALVTTGFTQSCVRLFAISEDASTGIVFTFLFALGIVLVTVSSKDSHVGVELIMGNVDALNFKDLALAGWVFLLTTALFFLFWRAFCVTSFDPVFAFLCGISNGLFGYFLMSLVAICAIGAFRAVGVLMVLAFFVTPVLLARLLTHHLNRLLLCSCLIAASSSIVGVALSRHLLSLYGLACSTSGLIVCLLFIAYCLCLMVKYLRFRHT